MNPITNGLPPMLDGILMDFAQMTGAISYNDIGEAGKNWGRASVEDRAALRGLALQWKDDAEPDGASRHLEGKVAEAVIRIAQLQQDEAQAPRFRAGDLVLYQNGERFELGLVKSVAQDGSGAFVYYSEGDTAAKTPWDCLHRITNAFAVSQITLGGIRTELKNGRAFREAG